MRDVVASSVDLASCDTEPIHVIGAIQPHGALVAADATTLSIEYASANCATLLGAEARDLLARPLIDLLGSGNCTDLLARQLDPLTPDLLRPWFPGPVTGAAGCRIECFPHRHDGRIILEFVPFEDELSSVWHEDLLRQRIVAELIKPDTARDLAQTGAQVIRQVTGFDRVMIYRFAADRHGEVIAESTDRDDRFFGLHYPASDIPDPARRHFLLNVVRTIPDINAAPSPILSRLGGVADASHRAPLDLTYSKLRAVAPVHIEYLNNMGVGASMSVSLIANGELWGLVACHHYGPLHLPWSRFRLCEMLGGIISVLLQSFENSARLRQSIRAERIASDIERESRSGTSLPDVIARNWAELSAQAGAQGMVLRVAGQTTAFGRLPDPLPDLAPLDASLVEGVAAVDNLPDVLALGPAQSRLAAGAAFLELSEDGDDFLVFLREQFERSITWAGKPDKVKRRLSDGTVRLSPRGSFALWREERKGRSRPFSQSDLEALRILRRVLFALNSLDRERSAVAAQKTAEADEARLRLLLLDATRRSSLGELASALAHELNQPLAAVTNYINACRQELKNHGIAVPADVDALIENAVTESSRAADLVRRLRNFITQGELSPEPIELAAVVRQGIDLAFASSADPLPDLIVDIPTGLPPLSADPVQIGQVVLNLVRNSLAAMSDQPDRRLTIAARRVQSDIEVSVRDTGCGILPEIAPRLFEPFHSSTTSGMGIGLSLCRSIVEAHSGHIWSRAHDSGAELVFSLPADRRHAHAR